MSYATDVAIDVTRYLRSVRHTSDSFTSSAIIVSVHRSLFPNAVRQATPSRVPLVMFQAYDDVQQRWQRTIRDHHRHTKATYTPYQLTLPQSRKISVGIVDMTQ